MSTQNTFHCIVDDTPLTTNLDEIGPWVEDGTVTLVVPLYTLERLHVLKKDASQIGQNARKAVKFLDQTADLPNNPVVIQGPDDQYKTWSEVEARYASSVIQRENTNLTANGEIQALSNVSEEQEALPEQQIKYLTLSSDDLKTSPVSTPPLSPSASEPQSTKTSPEVRSVSISKHDATPVPPALKALINYVVWYIHENAQISSGKNLIFLTNSADAAHIAKDFGVIPKTIHQLRASITTNLKQSEQNDQPSQKKKPGTRAMSFKNECEPKTLFRYDEVSSEEEEELVFKPRAQEMPRPGSSGRGTAANFRGRSTMHSPSHSLNASASPKPQVPVEEIDPDSFDRGTFARGSTPLANVGNNYGPSNNTSGRGGQRNFTAPMQRGGGGFRGNTLRGRGRGRLFVP